MSYIFQHLMEFVVLEQKLLYYNLFQFLLQVLIILEYNVVEVEEFQKVKFEVHYMFQVVRKDQKDVVQVEVKLEVLYLYLCDE